MSFRRIRIGTGGGGSAPLGRLLLGGAGVALLAGVVLLTIFGGLLLAIAGLLASGICAAVAMLRRHLGDRTPSTDIAQTADGHLSDPPERSAKWRGKLAGEIVDVEESDVTLLREDDSRRR